MCLRGGLGLWTVGQSLDWSLLSVPSGVEEEKSEGVAEKVVEAKKVEGKGEKTLKVTRGRPPRAKSARGGRLRGEGSKSSLRYDIEINKTCPNLGEPERKKMRRCFLTGNSAEGPGALLVWSCFMCLVVWCVQDVVQQRVGKEVEAEEAGACGGS